MKGSDVLYLSCALLFVPVLIGSFWVHLLQLEGTVNRFLHAWVLGFTTMLAVAQLLLVPMVAHCTKRLCCGKSCWRCSR